MTGLGPRDVEARFGSVADAFGPQSAVLVDGPERGCRVVWLTTGAGLDVVVNVDRGLDLRRASWLGLPVSFFAPGGDAAPSLVEPQGRGWGRSWPGGLLTTCGFRNVGPPVTDAATGEHYGQHGRAGALAARNVSTTAGWEGDRFVSTVAGTLREATLFGEHIECRREWRVVTGIPEIVMRDEIRNVGFADETILVLYHVNIGHPLLDDKTEVHLGTTTDGPFGQPEPGQPEEVSTHDVMADDDGWARAAVRNPADPVRFELGWRPEQLPCFTTWRSARAGAYALGLEPANCLPAGRPHELAAGRGTVLGPGETMVVDLVLGMRTGDR